MEHVYKPLMYGGLGAMYTVGAVKEKLDKNPDAAAAAKDFGEAGKTVLKMVPKKVISLSKDNDWAGSVKHTVAPAAAETVKKTIPNQIKRAVNVYNSHMA